MPEIPAEVPAPEEEVPPPSVGEAPPEIPYLEPEIPIFVPEGSYVGQDFPVVGQETPVIAPENQNQVSGQGQENHVITTASPYQNQYQSTYQSTEFVPAQENPVVVTASPIQWESPLFMPETPVIVPSPELVPEDTEYGEEWSRSGDDEEAVDWAANDMWRDAQPETTEEAPMPEEWTPPQPISLRADTVGQTSAFASGIPAIASIAGVAAVSIAIVAVLALAVVRSRARANTARRSLNPEKAPLRGAPNTADVMISMKHEDDSADDTEPSGENCASL
ncbi:uncharacterized protein IUM83_05641 [Phytophthora cinnamomi]|nr:hypothetical protein IUM83_05641 [Phytophthora cinnamomi]